MASAEDYPWLKVGAEVLEVSSTYYRPAEVLSVGKRYVKVRSVQAGGEVRYDLSPSTGAPLLRTAGGTWNRVTWRLAPVDDIQRRLLDQKAEVGRLVSEADRGLEAIRLGRGELTPINLRTLAATLEQAAQAEEAYLALKTEGEG